MATYDRFSFALSLHILGLALFNVAFDILVKVLPHNLFCEWKHIWVILAVVSAVDIDRSHHIIFPDLSREILPRIQSMTACQIFRSADESATDACIFQAQGFVDIRQKFLA